MEPNQRPCPYCGSKSVDIEVEAASANAKAFTPGIIAKGREKETKKGHFSATDNAKYPNGVYIIQIVNRKKKDYLKIVIDERTGEVVRCVHEPLSEHRPRSKQ